MERQAPPSRRTHTPATSPTHPKQESLFSCGITCHRQQGKLQSNYRKLMSKWLKVNPAIFSAVPSTQHSLLFPTLQDLRRGTQKWKHTWEGFIPAKGLPEQHFWTSLCRSCWFSMAVHESLERASLLSLQCQRLIQGKLIIQEISDKCWFRSAALWTAAEGEGKGRDHVVCSHTGAVCCPLRAELISSCTTEPAQLRGWGSLDISPPMSRRWKLEAASSHNTAIAPTAHAAWAGQLQKSTKQAADATWNHRSRQVSASEFLNLLGRNRKEWRNKNAICIC